MGVSVEGVMVVEFTPPGGAQGGKVEGEADGKHESNEEKARRHDVVIAPPNHSRIAPRSPCAPSPGSLPPSPPRLIVGLTGPKLLENKKHAEFLHPWTQRAHDTLTFITSILTFSPAAAIETKEEKEEGLKFFSRIKLSEDGGRERKVKGWAGLEMFVVGVVEEEGGGGLKMSSTDIRRRRGRQARRGRRRGGFEEVLGRAWMIGGLVVGL
ncbi:hypothetical protein BGX38DRAFT_1171342 [Terfezia claveryi]|nr:hypothetical protein BGX38DRAFT_1171342 [Terfezia claveryi]